MIRLVPGITLLLFIAAELRADIALPPNLQYVDPVVRFDGTAKLSEYVFRLRFTTFSGAPTGEYRYLEVPDGKPFNLNAMRRLGDMQLLGLKRDEFERRRKEDPSLTWLTSETPDVLASEVPAPPLTGPINKKPPVSAYRVTLEDGKLIVVEAAAAGDRKASTAPPNRTWISGTALALASAAFGLWIVRYRRTPPAPASHAT